MIIIRDEQVIKISVRIYQIPKIPYNYNACKNTQQRHLNVSNQSHLMKFNLKFV